MKVLMIDDESRKLKHLKLSLENIKGFNNDSLDVVLDLKNAKEKMKSESYDFIVLDLKIGEYLGQEYEEMVPENTGLSFIEEIFETKSLHIPNEIIILTEYEELITDEIKEKSSIENLNKTPFERRNVHSLGNYDHFGIDDPIAYRRNRRKRKGFEGKKVVIRKKNDNRTKWKTI